MRKAQSGFRALAPIACLMLAAANPAVAAAAAAEYPARTLSMAIIDDGVHTIYYVGQEDEGIPPTPVVPLYIVSNQQPLRTDVPFASLSPIIRYRGPSQLTFYHSPPSDDPDVPLPPIAGSVHLPEDSRDVVLLFFTEDFPGRKYRILALNDSLETFPKNTIRIFNFSSGYVAVELDGDNQSLDPNANRILPLDTSNTYQRLKIARYDAAASRWRLAQNRNIRVRDGTRSTYLIFNRPGQRDGRIMVRRIEDPVQLRQDNFIYYEEDDEDDRDE